MRFKNTHAYLNQRENKYTLEQVVAQEVDDEQRDDQLRELSAKLDKLTQIVGSMAAVLTPEQQVALARSWGYEEA